MPKNWNKLVTIQEAVAAYAAGDDLDAHCFLYAGDRVKPYRETVSGDIITLPPYDPPLTLYTKTGRFIDSLIADIVPVQSGTGDPSPDNVRPISGWTGITLRRTGINIWDEEWESGVYSPSGEKAPNSSYIRSTNFIQVFPNTTYYWKTRTRTGRICFYDENRTFISRSNSFGNNIFATPANCHYITFFTVDTTYNHDISINYPSNDIDYHAYNGNTYTVNWETEAGTVYGGQLDITKGVLTVTDAMIDSYNGETLPSTWISDRDVYAEGTTPTIGAQVVYKLAEPLTYQLTPTEVTLLLGENNIFADTGPITLTYVETREET